MGEDPQDVPSGALERPGLRCLERLCCRQVVSEAGRRGLGHYLRHVSDLESSIPICTNLGRNTVQYVNNEDTPLHSGKHVWFDTEVLGVAQKAKSRGNADGAPETPGKRVSTPPPVPI